MRKKLFYIMGKSASGKDTIYNILLSDETINKILKPLVMYTTRPMRDNEVEGVTYYYVDDNKYHEMKEQGIIVECREYKTVYGIWAYFTAMDHQLETNDSLVAVGVPLSCIPIMRYIQENKIDIDLVPIYIDLEDGERLIRSIKREQTKDKPNYEEICRRYINSDQLEFTEEMLEEIGVYRFSNDNKIEDTVKQIKEFIFSKLSEEGILW